MGYQLRREIRDAIPAGLLSAGERAVLLELADFARDATREAFPGMAELARCVDMTPQGVKKALQKLATKGLEVRVPFGKDANGRPLYAHSGRQTTYLLPIPADIAKLVRQYPQKEETPVPPLMEEGGTAVQERGYSGIEKEVRQYHPSPHESLNEPSPPPAPSPPTPEPEEEEASPEGQTNAAALARVHAASLTPVEVARLTTSIGKALDAGHSADGIAAELARPTGGLASVAAGLISRMRALASVKPVVAPEPSTPTDALAVWHKELRDAPRCPHELNGGHLPMPSTGEPVCVMCRAEARRAWAA